MKNMIGIKSDVKISRKVKPPIRPITKKENIAKMLKTMPPIAINFFVIKSFLERR